jgi:alkylhydroperoxidase/carboxymuconolactone decarboxylase family protein YurZ
MAGMDSTDVPKRIDGRRCHIDARRPGGIERPGSPSGLVAAAGRLTSTRTGLHPTEMMLAPPWSDEIATMAPAEDGFRLLTIGDPAALATMARTPEAWPDVAPLDGLTRALLGLAALIAVDAPASSYRAVVDAATRAGARREHLLAVLVAVAGTVGSARVVSAAPKIALAAGYDVEAALE